MSVLIPPTTRALHRQIARDNLPHRCTISKPGSGLDAAGRPTGGTIIVAQNRPCKVVPAASVEARVVADQLDAPAKMLVRFLRDELVEVGYTIAATGEDGGPNGDDPWSMTLRVTGDVDGGRAVSSRRVFAEVMP